MTTTTTMVPAPAGIDRSTAHRTPPAEPAELTASHMWGDPDRYRSDELWAREAPIMNVEQFVAIASNPHLDPQRLISALTFVVPPAPDTRESVATTCRVRLAALSCPRLTESQLAFLSCYRMSRVSFVELEHVFAHPSCSPMVVATLAVKTPWAFLDANVRSALVADVATAGGSFARAALCLADLIVANGRSRVQTVDSRVVMLTQLLEPLVDRPNAHEFVVKVAGDWTATARELVEAALLVAPETTT